MPETKLPGGLGERRTQEAFFVVEGNTVITNQNDHCIKDGKRQ